MALIALRVTRRTEWNGWQYAPPAGRDNSPEFADLWKELSQDKRLTDRQRAKHMKEAGCRDERACYPDLYAGDIIIVEEGHPHLEMMVERTRRFRPDAAIPPVDDLLQDEKFKRLIQAPVPV